MNSNYLDNLLTVLPSPPYEAQYNATSTSLKPVTGCTLPNLTSLPAPLTPPSLPALIKNCVPPFTPFPLIIEPFASLDEITTSCPDGYTFTPSSTLKVWDSVTSAYTSGAIGYGGASLTIPSTGTCTYGIDVPTLTLACPQGLTTAGSSSLIIVNPNTTGTPSSTLTTTTLSNASCTLTLAGSPTLTLPTIPTVICPSGISFNDPIKFAAYGWGTNTYPSSGSVLLGTGGSITANVSGGSVISLNIVSGGYNYTTAPAISFSGPGTGASVTAVVSGGAITSFTSLIGGTGYTTAPTVVISPATGANTGNLDYQLIDYTNSGWHNPISNPCYWNTPLTIDLPMPRCDGGFKVNQAAALATTFTYGVGGTAGFTTNTVALTQDSSASGNVVTCDLSLGGNLILNLPNYCNSVTAPTGSVTIDTTSTTGSSAIALGGTQCAPTMSGHLYFSPLIASVLPTLGYPVPGGGGGTRWQTPNKELDPSVDVPAGTFVYISPLNPLVTGSTIYYDITQRIPLQSPAGIWYAAYTVPRATTISGNLNYNVPQIPYESSESVPSGSPLAGDLDQGAHWIFFSQTPACF